MSTLEVGDAAPPFDLLDQHENRVRLEDYRGRKVLVYFYPAADPPAVRAAPAIPNISSPTSAAARSR